MFVFIIKCTQSYKTNKIIAIQFKCRVYIVDVLINVNILSISVSKGYEIEFAMNRT